MWQECPPPPLLRACPFIHPKKGLLAASLRPSRRRCIGLMGQSACRFLKFTLLSSCCSNTDVHTVASLLKLYLRELPEPVIPFAKYEDFLSCGQLLSKDKGEVSAPSTLPPFTLHAIPGASRLNEQQPLHFLLQGLSQSPLKSMGTFPMTLMGFESGLNILSSSLESASFAS